MFLFVEYIVEQEEWNKRFGLKNTRIDWFFVVNCDMNERNYIKCNSLISIQTQNPRSTFEKHK